MEVYDHIATSVNATVLPSGFVKFEEAVNELAAAKYSACSRPEESRVQPDDIPQLPYRGLFSRGANFPELNLGYRENLC